MSTWIVVLTFAVACGLYAYQLSVPQFPAFYDSGVYVVGALNFISGSLPYRDFIFVNPPGILYILAPAALVGKVLGSHVMLLVGRVMGIAVTAAAAAVLPWMLRRHGSTVMVIAGAGAATSPLAVTVSSAIKLDAYCLFLSLLGAALVLTRLEDVDSVRDRARTWLLAGFLFGVAGAVKLWAVFPFVALALCVLIWRRTRLGYLFLGTATGFLAPTLPFLILAPRSFLHQVIGDQLFQPLLASTSPSVSSRLADISSFVWLPSNLQDVGTALVAVAFLGYLVSAATSRKSVTPTETFLALSAFFTTWALLVAPAWDLYYAYFDSAFLLGLLATVFARVLGAVHRWTLRLPLSDVTRRFSRIVLRLSATVLLVGLAVANVITFQLFALTGINTKSVQHISTAIPRDSCVVYVYVIEGVNADRLSPSSSACSAFVDPYGMFQSAGMNVQHPPEAFVLQWKSVLQRASFAVLPAPETSYVPWTPQLLHWFHANYRLVLNIPDALVYRHEVPVKSASVASTVVG